MSARRPPAARPVGEALGGSANGIVTGKLTSQNRDVGHPSGLRRVLRAVFSTHHRNVGFGYLAISVVAVAVGTALSLVMRVHLAWPDWAMPLHGPILPEEYLALVTMHGTLMLFFVMTVAPQSGFGNLILPAQIGAERMSFPRLNALSMWMTAAALVVLLAAFFVPAGAPISGWTAYPTLSTTPLAGPGEGAGMDLWMASLALFCIAGTISATNTLTTVSKLRCEGMTWQRLPLTVWGWITAALLSVLAFSVLLAALLLLFCDRRLGTGFFTPANDLINMTIVPHHGNGTPLLWLHLFWFFGHPEVYISVLPGMGLTSMVLANFARRRVFAYKLMIATTLLIGFLGILLWGHHMFVSGLNPFAGSVFAISTMAIAIPASAKVLSWIGTIWRSRPKLSTPMLFALGFVSMFVSGGLTGPILAQPILDEYLHNTFFVVAHFHLIMAMAGIFGIFCAIYYWFPLLFGTTLREGLGKIHFWGTFLFAYSTFLPMHFTGLAGEPRHYAQLTGIAGPAGALLRATMPLQRHISVSALGLAAFQFVFLWNFIVSLARKRRVEQNPWSATTLEWAPRQPSGEEERVALTVVRGPCHYAADGRSFQPQWAEAAESSPASEATE